MNIGIVQTRPHNCPDCKCPEQLCEFCHGFGFVTETKHEEPHDRGDGVMYGSGSWMTKPCPNGCPQPQAWF